jgi:hypothetical protein
MWKVTGWGKIGFVLLCHHQPFEKLQLISGTQKCKNQNAKCKSATSYRLQAARHEP